MTNMLIHPVYGQGVYYLVDLYQNNNAGDANSTAADFVLCDFEGYATVMFPAEQMGEATLTEEGAEVAYLNNPVQWQNNGVQQGVYGYIVRSAVTNNVLWVNWFGFQTILDLKQVLSVDVTLGLLG